jgi:hypothetical protein
MRMPTTLTRVQKCQWECLSCGKIDFVGAVGRGGHFLLLLLCKSQPLEVEAATHNPAKKGKDLSGMLRSVRYARNLGMKLGQKFLGKNHDGEGDEDDCAIAMER